MKEKLALLCLLPLRENKPVALTAIWMVIIGDIIFSPEKSDLVIFGILGSYVITILFYKKKSKSTFSFCFFILGLLFIEFVFTGASQYTEKAAVWLFLFMAIGILQELLEKR